MTNLLPPLPSPFKPPRRPDPRQSQALMLAASAVGHTLLFGWMIWHAAGDELNLPEWENLPIIQLELQPPPLPLLRPRVVQLPPQPQPKPLDQEQPRPEPKPVPQIQEQTPQPPQSVTLDPLQPITAPSPLQQQLPSVAPEAPLEEAQITRPEARSAPSQITTYVPSLRAEPQPSPEALSRAPSLTPPAPINRVIPSLAAPSTSAQADTSDAVDSRVTDEVIRRRKEDEDAEAAGAPSAPVPRLASPVPGVPAPSAAQSSPVPGVSDAWRVAPSSQGERNARALRTSPLGCRARDRLTESERLLCDERLNADIANGTGPVIRGTGNAQRDARFAAEGARERYLYEEKRRPLSGGTGIVGTQDCPGSNLGNGCAGSLLDPSLQMDSTSNIRTNKLDGLRPSAPKTPGSSGTGSRPGNGTDD